MLPKTVEAERMVSILDNKSQSASEIFDETSKLNKLLFVRV